MFRHTTYFPGYIPRGDREFDTPPAETYNFVYRSMVLCRFSFLVSQNIRFAGKYAEKDRV